LLHPCWAFWNGKPNITWSYSIKQPSEADCLKTVNFLNSVTLLWYCTLLFLPFKSERTSELPPQIPSTKMKAPITMSLTKISCDSQRYPAHSWKKGYRCCRRRSIGKVLNERMIIRLSCFSTFTVLLIRSGCQSVCLNFLFWKVVGLTGATKCGFWTSVWAENWRQEIQLKNRTSLLLFWSI